MIMRRRHRVPPHRRDCWDADARLADMDADGVDVQVVSPTPVFFSYGAAPAEAAKIARIFNDLALGDLRAGAGAAAAVLPGAAAGSGRRLRRARTLPGRRAPRRRDRQPRRRPRSRRRGHRDVPAARRVARRAGVRAPVGHADLAAHRPLDGAVADRHAGRDAPVDHGDGARRRVRRGRPRRCASASPTAAARSRSGSAGWTTPGTSAPTSSARREHPPSHYLGRFYVDSVVFDERALRLLVDTVGPTGCMVGSDYPYPFGERPVGRRRAAQRVPGRRTRDDPGGNARDR